MGMGRQTWSSFLITTAIKLRWQMGMEWCVKRIKAIPRWQSACKEWEWRANEKIKPSDSQGGEQIISLLCTPRMYFSTSLPPFTTRAPAAFNWVPLEEYEYILHCKAGSTLRLANPFRRGEISLQPNWIGICAWQGNAAVVINSQLFY